MAVFTQLPVQDQVFLAFIAFVILLCIGTALNNYRKFLRGEFTPGE